jgi:hypothetical protein
MTREAFNYSPMIAIPCPADTGTPSAIPATVTPGGVVLLAANKDRLGAMIFNDSSQTLYLLIGSGVPSSDNYSKQVGAGDTFTLPLAYIGPISGIWAAVNGNARVTEFTLGPPGAATRT